MRREQSKSPLFLEEEKECSIFLLKHGGLLIHLFKALGF